MHCALVISPHADDAAIFCGGTLIKLADEGWRVVLVRVTDDRTDSAGYGYDETIARNTAELQTAAGLMGIAEVVELGFQTDCLDDVPSTVLRERFIYLFRKYRPYAVFTFDADGLYEENLDHIAVARAANEAFWTSMFHLHHPEHVEEGLNPFAVCERWYFARRLPEVTHVEDITDVFERKVRAICAHDTMMRHMVQQQRMHLATWGRHVPALDEAQSGPVEPLIRLVFEAQSRETASAHGLAEGRLGEAFRLVRFGALEGFYQTAGQPISGAPQGPPRARIEG